MRRATKRGSGTTNHHHVVCPSCGVISDVDCAFGYTPCLTAAAGGKKVSLADLIVLGGCAAVEQAAKNAGHDVTVPFAPGRTDASRDQTDAESFAVLEPAADGFRNYLRAGQKLPPETLLVDRANLLTLAAEDSQRELARRWLTRFGPATADDLQWWTGWNKTTLRHALRELPVEEVDLHGDTGIALASDDPGDAAAAPPVAALLPALDPTPMGWKRRDWFLSIPQHHVFDNRGNIGPTLWWNGEIIGSWAVTSTGQVRTAVLADRGGAARSAIQDIATRLEARLQRTAITPAIRTPLERQLVERIAEEPAES